LENPTENNKILADQNNLLNTGNTARDLAVELASKLVTQGRTLVEELKDQLGVRSKLNEFDKAQLSLSRQIASAASENNVELRKSGRLDSQILKDKKIQASIERENNVLSKELSEKQKDQADRLIKVNRLREKAAEQFRKTGRAFFEDTEAKYDAELKSIAQTTSADVRRYAVLKELGELQSEVIANREKEVVIQGRITSALGITGAVLDNINKIGFRAFGGIGINLATFGEELKKAKEEADAMADSLIEREKETGESLDDFLNRVQTMKAALPGIKKAFLSAINDPLTVAATLASKFFTGYKALDQTTAEMTRLSGKAGTVALKTSSAVFNLTTFSQIAKIATGLTERLGVNVGLAFSEQNLRGAGLLQNYLGLSEEQAGNLALQSQAYGKNLDKNTRSIIEGVNNFNKMNKTALSHGLILRDVANASDGIAASFGGSVEKLSKAAAAARNLGIELKELDSIASSLLDFESSIESELEAQLLTGREINLSKARELALTNDLEGLGKELFKNATDLNHYGSMNRIQQEAYAKALGMSRDQLAKVAYQQAISANLSGEALQNATGMTAEELKRMSISERLLKMQEKMNQLIADYGVWIAGVAGVYLSITKFAQLLTSLQTISLAIRTRGLSAEATSLAIQTKSTKLAAIKTAAEAGGSIAKLPIAGAFLAGGVIGAILATLHQQINAVNVNDGIISPSGGLLVSGPKGSIQTDPQDYLIATTNRPGTGNQGNNNQALLRKIDELIVAVNRGGNVYLDGNKVGQSLVLGSSQFS